VAAVALLTLLLVGCSSDENTHRSTTTDPAPVATTELTVVAVEFEYDAPGWTVPVGETITINFTNDGTIPHEWAVLEAGVDIDQQQEFREDMVLFEVEALTEGTSTSQTFLLDQAGTYEIICALEGHLDAGMRATITAPAKGVEGAARRDAGL
jgi:uncharacterized cupredoxin-like copper-binding protein